MAKATPKLEQRKDDTGCLRQLDVPILIDFSFDGQRMWIQTGEKVDRNKWDTKNHRVKPNVIGSVEINAIIASKCEKINKIYREAILIGKQPTVAYLRNKLNDNKLTTKKSLVQYFDEFIEGYRIKASEGTVKKLKTNKKHLLEFAKDYRVVLDFDSIDVSFLNKYAEFFQNKKKHTNGTISKNIKILKWFLNYCVKMGYHSNSSYQSFSYKSIEPEIISLTSQEVARLFNLKLTNLCLAQVRDVFCFCCFTSLRYSDVKNLKKTDVADNCIEIISVKTKSKVAIPLIDDAKVILDRYNGMLGNRALPVISNQKMNEYLKELGKLAKLDRPITKVRYRGNNRLEETLPLYEFLTTHLGRKTFITYMFRRNVDSELIRSISNHKSIASFSRYNNISNEHKEDAMKIAFKNFGELEKGVAM